MDVEDTTTWLPLDGLEPGFGANRSAPTTHLAGRELIVRYGDGHEVRHRFTGPDRMEWVGCGEGSYEAFDVAPGLVYAQCREDRVPRVTRSLFADLTSGHALEVVTRIGEPDAVGTVCSQEFRVGTVGGVEVSGPPPAPSTDLVGRRVMWIYSATHSYEHVYLSPNWYTWQCLAGPELGLADTDACSTYRLRPGIYVFTWREKVVPCAAVTVADHTVMRSHGALFGLDATGTAPTHFTFGAVGRLLSVTVHPEPYQPLGSR